MNVAIISDVHCGGTGCLRQREFVCWLDELQADSLWLLGDIFHVGWDFRPAEQVEYTPVYAALERVVARGIDVLFVPGNHDFGVANLMHDRVGADVQGPHVREVDGCRVFLAHGDEADSGWRYRLARSLLRSKGFSMVVKSMGVHRGTRLLAAMAGDPTGSGTVWASTRQWLDEQLVGADLAIIGHVHTASSDGSTVTLAPGVDGARWLNDGVLTGPRGSV